MPSPSRWAGLLTATLCALTSALWRTPSVRGDSYMCLFVCLFVDVFVLFRGGCLSSLSLSIPYLLCSAILMIFHTHTHVHGCAVSLCLVVCLTLLAFFFLPSHFSLKYYIIMHCICIIVSFCVLCRKYIGQIWTDSLVHDERALKYLVDVIGQVPSLLYVSAYCKYLQFLYVSVRVCILQISAV